MLATCVTYIEALNKRSLCACQFIRTATALGEDVSSLTCERHPDTTQPECTMGISVCDGSCNTVTS